jgi:CubicO group peptidase (beta-lactamase class C family)
MIRTVLAAASLLLATAPAIAQSQQEALDARYDRALAAGYKALMLCSAIAIAERNGATRTPESVAAWELAGIQSSQAAMIGDLPHTILRGPSGHIAEVQVRWAEDMPPRVAGHDGPDTGCAIRPLGAPEGNGEREQSLRAEPAQTVPATAAQEPSAGSGKSRGRSLRPVDDRGRQVIILAAKALDQTRTETYGKGARTTAIVVRSFHPDGSRDFNATFYADGFSEATPQRTWSVAKSIAATLIGAAVQRGEADVNASAGLGLSDADPRRAITVDHLLRMASGRYSDTPGNRTDPLYFGGASVAEVALDWPLIAAPGSTFRYANNDTLAAVAAIRGTFAALPPAALFAKLGMKGSVAEADWQGGYILSSQVWATADDLARLGQLYLDDGVLPSGERILPQGWVKYVTTPSGPQPPTGTFGYGGGFWLLNREEGVPADTFAAIGNRGQYLVIVPSRRVVIVRRGEDPAGSGFDIAAFTRDVLAALASG